ncbi:MAG: hypothetical protein ABIW76_14195 [Fibrobacteria bacterium]
MRALACLTGLYLLPIQALAAFPTEDMGSMSLGLQYGFAFRGQNITAAAAPSHETIHTLSLAYAPIPYLSIEAGIGLDRFDVETSKSVRFDGEYGLSPLFGLVVKSPYFALDFVRIAAGYRGLYLNSEDDRGYRYSGTISSPFLGAVVSPSGFFDIEAGARGHIVDGAMSGPSTSEQVFANEEILRGYATFTVKSPTDGAFLSLDIDISPAFTSDWADGPREAQVGISFGAILGGQAKPEPAKDATGRFPAYSEMKETQRKMADEIK